MNFPEFQIAERIDADEQQIGVRRMERDEVADIGLEAADFLTPRIERMDQADLISGLSIACVACAQCQRQCRRHAAFLIRALTIWGMVRTTSRGTSARHRT